MNFYSYAYIVQQGQFNALMQYGVSFLLLIALLLVSIQFIRHRLNSRYRDLTILLSLIIVFVLGIRWSEYDSSLRNSEESSRMANFVVTVSQRLGVPKEDIRVSALHLNEDVIISVGNRFYRAHFTNNFEAYSLTQVHMIDSQIKVVDIAKE
ncbi:DUF3290 domain-containing protein [Veillonella criceti]|uniref:Protein of uncharacterized function (DUF3290) n=1 Tax=Veillonella criceti TaxID=103891 RepID=A0A380NNS4_9FIRM|nr:DUF3290 domain-containing protein [Veillonella criceti]SUP44459.1 Protein of uncharacterised function (DUF3290) [Veillonella criceti]